MTKIPSISLRQLKSMLYVAEYRNVTRAADALNRSQTAITKAVSDLEAELGYTLFERTSTGMQITAYGEVIARRIQLVAQEFAHARTAYLQFLPESTRAKNNPLFTMDISYKRLAALVAVHDTRSISLAADQLGVTKTAVYNSARHIEELIDLTLFEKEPNGVSPTAYCRILVSHIKIAFKEVRRALEDLASIDGSTIGRLAIGTHPYTRTVLTPKVMSKMLDAYAEIEITTQEGSYKTLEVALRCGEIDCIVGVLESTNDKIDLKQEALFQDHLSVIARYDHPLHQKTHLNLADLMDYCWVLPIRKTLTRRLFDQTLAASNIPPPKRVIETTSASIMRGILVDSDHLAIFSEHIIHFDEQSKLLKALKIDLPGTNRSIGVTTLQRSEPSPSLRRFLEELRLVSSEIQRAS